MKACHMPHVRLAQRSHIDRQSFLPGPFHRWFLDPLVSGPPLSPRPLPFGTIRHTMVVRDSGQEVSGFHARLLLSKLQLPTGGGDPFFRSFSGHAHSCSTRYSLGALQKRLDPGCNVRLLINQPSHNEEDFQFN